MSNNIARLLFHDESLPSVDLPISKILLADTVFGHEDPVIEIRKMNDGTWRVIYPGLLIPKFTDLSGIQFIHEDDLVFHEASVRDGGVDMKLSGSTAMTFIKTLVELFEQNGGKNFLTLTVEKDPQTRYGIDIRNLNGEFSAAEKIQMMQKEIDQLKEQLAAK